jgi:hypothetical protein
VIQFPPYLARLEDIALPIQREIFGTEYPNMAGVPAAIASVK